MKELSLASESVKHRSGFAGPTTRFRLRISMLDAMVFLALIPSLAIVGLLIVTVWTSVRESIIDFNLTFRHYIELYTDSFALSAFFNTLGFSFSALVVAFLFGVPIAWIAERSDVKGKAAIYTIMTLGVFIPSFFTAMGWLFLLHPRIGMANVWLKNAFGLEAPLSIVNVPGMGFVQGLGLASVVFVLTAANLRITDARLEESARMSGASFFTVMRRITLPLAWPGLLASGLYVFTIGIGAFDVPLVIGLTNRVYTFSSYLYVISSPISGLPNYGLVAAFASFMMALALVLSWWYSRVLLKARKYQIVSGKGFRGNMVQLGNWKYGAWAFVLIYFVISKLMPMLLMVWASFLPYFQAPSLKALGNVSFINYENIKWASLFRALSNSVILMMTVPIISLTISVIFSWVVLRSRSKYRLAFDFIAFLPHAVPHAVFAFAAVVFALAIPPEWFDMYGSLSLLIIVMSLAALSFGSRITNGALIQIHPELEEAAYMSGASMLNVLRRIVFPLLKPAFLFGWLWIALLTFRELTAPMILFSPENITYSVAVWNLWFGGSLNQAAAVNVIMFALMLPMVILYWRYTGKVRIGD